MIEFAYSVKWVVSPEIECAAKERARLWREGETDLAHLQCFESDLLFWREIILNRQLLFLAVLLQIRKPTSVRAK
jgi:hypothetical protein